MKRLGVLLVAALAGWVVTFLALWLYQVGSGHSVSSAWVVAGSDLRVIVGTGRKIPGSLAITALGPRGIAMAQAPVQPFDARTYSDLSLSVDGLAEGQTLQFVWSTAASPRQPRYLDLPLLNARDQGIELAKAPEWQGRIIAVGLILRGRLDQPVSLHELRLTPAGVTPLTTLQDLRANWVGTADWSGRSPNFNRGGPVESRLPLVPIVALWVLLSGLIYFAINAARHGSRALSPYLILCCLGWAALETRWQAELFHRLQRAEDSFAGLSEVERQRAAPDGKLFELVEQIRSSLPGDSDRVFIVTSDPNAAMVGRARYHLLPQNTSLGLQALPSESEARPGDFVLMLNPAKNVSFDREKRLLVSRNHQLPVALIRSWRGAGELFRVEEGE
ncbi:hypothetical protein G3480_03240 [Thiorhodococcus mannitoliphagus]|uniref:Uncharacterized protein n=1 Tax=Thiorhodococcus mannitoliphagus TaxID=329406 RepID=A0A6P1DRM9_9GAMM|nr:hypothetical protein [Thiorhodococcus mannitoliphagus]NEX19336.1 hypothetical protein [Thiorhodococcus mannitoliphagus]